MKKWLILFLLLVSIFIGYNKVGATVFDYDNASSTQVLSDTDISNLNEVINYIKQNDNRDFLIINYYENATLGYRYYVYFLKPASDINSNYSWYLNSFVASSGTNPYRVMYLGLGNYSSTGISTNSSVSNSILSTNYFTNRCSLIHNASESNINSFKTCLSNYYFNNTNYNESSFIFQNNYSSSSDVSASIPLVYSSFNLPIGRNTANYNNLSIVYNNENFDLSLGDYFIPYLNALNGGLFFDKVSVNKYGKGQYGLVSNSITYSSSSLIHLNLKCPTDREFESNFCYFNSSDLDIDLSYFDVYLNFHNSSIPIVDDNYYIFTYRFDSKYNIIPTNVHYLDSVSNEWHASNVIDYNIINNGVYKDVQIVFQADLPNIVNTTLENFYIGFFNVDNYDIDFNDFNFGFYNVYKITDNSTSVPTYTDLNNDYNRNNINSIASGSSSDDNFFTNFNLNNYGLGSIITAPLRIYNAMKITDTCEPLVVPFPNSSQSITIPCIKNVIEENFGLLFTILQTILSGLICYKICVNWYATIKNMQTPKTDAIEVVDL